MNEESGQISVEEQANNVDTHTEERHAPAWFEHPRWGGQEVPITPRRARGVRDKRAFEKFRATTPLRRLMTGEEFILRSQLGGDLVGRIAWTDISVALVSSVAYSCRSVQRNLLVLLAAAMRIGGYLGVAATFDELAQVTHKSVSTTRRAIADLVELELVLAPVPLFVKYGAVSSQRGNAYRVGPAVYAAVDAARIRERHGQANGCSRPSERKEQPSGHVLSCLSGSPERTRSANQNGCSERPSAEVEPEFFSAVVPGGATDAAGRSTRQAESTSSSPEAGQAVSDEEKSWWLAASLASIGAS